jgi:hypothetical protein
MVHRVPGMATVTYCFSLHCVQQGAHGATRKRGPPAAGRLEHALHGSVCCTVVEPWWWCLPFEKQATTTAVTRPRTPAPGRGRVTAVL